MATHAEGHCTPAQSGLRTYTPRGLLNLAGDGDPLSPSARVHHAHSLAPAQVELPPLLLGSTFLARWAVREGPGDISWRAERFECVAPATFILTNVLVHSAAGIICLDDAVIDETLAHTDPNRHGYSLTEQGVAIAPQAPRYLPGTHITILAGGTENYYHSLVESVMRLSILPPHLLGSAESVLHPSGAAAQTELLALLDLPAALPCRAVQDNDTFVVERLVFPWTAHGLSSYHPCVGALFDTLSSHVPAMRRAFPKRIYLDRRGTPLRHLINEGEVVAALQKLGFVPVSPETLDVADQVRLFRGAEMIVAPHGAALTNIGFCRPGCIVLELHMDMYVNWCFRHLAALRTLSYDCVLGRSIDGTPDRPDMVQGLRWQISPGHVAAATDYLLRGIHT